MFAEDLAVFFNPAEFADAATLAGVSVAGLFDKSYVVDPSGMGLAATRPAFILAAVSVPAAYAGLLLEHAGVLYSVSGIDPHGSSLGIYVLLLESA